MATDKRKLKVILSISLFLATSVKLSYAHGRLMEPPARNCMWRFGYNTPTNYDDNQLWCGGAAVMNNQNNGKCGICGDDYAMPVPRPHEAGGEYAKGIIVRRYAPGQEFDVSVELTANHQGTFHFKLCPVKDPSMEVTQECLDGYPLKVVDATQTIADKYLIMSNDKRKNFHFTVRLPPYTSCSHCVLQWTYIAANTWGTCADGSTAVGCGPQERFVNCADIAIIQNTGGRPPTRPDYANATSHNEVVPTPGLRHRGKQLPVLTAQRCVGTGRYKNNATTDEWCQKHCLKIPSECPRRKCKCLSGCDGVGNLEYQEGSGVWCMDQCLVYPPTKFCTPDQCSCY